ncbi:MAG: GHKL domain-containing protein [Pseudobutyrivibrio sp.]|nr:GHKL domain-containing protein [Pseudobutyrivibrio sp.]
MLKNDYALFYTIIAIWGLLELLNVKILLSQFLVLPKKEFKKSDCIIRFLIFFGILAIYGYATWNYNVVWRNILTLFIFLKSSIVMSGFYKLKLRHVAFIAFFVELVSFTGTNTALILLRLGFNWSINWIGAYLSEIAGELILLTLIMILQILRKRSIIKLWIAELEAFDFIVFILLLYALAPWETYICIEETMSSTYKNYVNIIVICVVITIIRTIIITRSKSSLENIKGLLEEQMQQLTEYYNQLIEKENESKKFRHDIKNLLLALHSMIENDQREKALSYIEDLQEVCNQSKVKYDSGNFIADAILSTKQTKAQHYNTKIEFEGFIPAERVKDTDMVIVLSNVLDNAIEACAKLDGQKVINISSILRKNAWILKTENPSEEISIKANYIETTKEEKEIHGFGLANIERAAKRYDGQMQLSYEEGVFKSIISFMLD